MAESIRNVLPMITGALLGLALFLFAVALRLFRRSRTDVFWRKRRTAGQRGWRLFVLAVGLLLFGCIACVFTMLSWVLFSDEDEPTPAPPLAAVTAVPTASTQVPDAGQSTEISVVLPSLTMSDPATPLENPATPEVLIITTTPVFTPTETTFPTFTPQITPVRSLATPHPEADIRITALDDQIAAALTPINPRASFMVGITRIYLFVEFTNMAQGVLWRRELYRDNVLVDGGEYLWGQAPAGTGYFFFGNDHGFDPGQYEIRLFIGDGDIPIHIMPFTIFEE